MGSNPIFLLEIQKENRLAFIFRYAIIVAFKRFKTEDKYKTKTSFSLISAFCFCIYWMQKTYGIQCLGWVERRR